MISNIKKSIKNFREAVYLYGSGCIASSQGGQIAEFSVNGKVLCEFTISEYTSAADTVSDFIIGLSEMNNELPLLFSVKNPPEIESIPNEDERLAAIFNLDRFSVDVLPQGVKH